MPQELKDEITSCARKLFLSKINYNFTKMLSNLMSYQNNGTL